MQSFCNGMDFKVSQERLLPVEPIANSLLKRNIWEKRKEQRNLSHHHYQNKTSIIYGSYCQLSEE